MNIKKLIIAAILLMLAVTQFFSKKENISSYESVATFENAVNLPAAVKIIFKETCYDCHSNHTNYPWYNAIGAVSLLINHDIEEGKEHLNFSDWEKYPTDKQNHKLAEVYEEVEEDEMPLKIYRITHGGLSDEQKKTILDWAKKYDGM